MEYRSVGLAEHGYADENERQYAQRRSIQHTMYSSGPDDLLDSLLVIANVCEQRALTQDKPLSRWYTAVSYLLRALMQMVTQRPDGPKPDQSLENPFLYFPDVERMN